MLHEPIAVDFAIVLTIRFNPLFVFVVLDPARRRIPHLNVTARPSPWQNGYCKRFGETSNPEGRRRAVLRVIKHLKVSEPRACRRIEQLRSTQRYEALFDLSIEVARESSTPAD